MAATVGRQLAGLGFSGRRIGYWIDHGAIAPSIHRGRGTGDPHQWSEFDIARLRAIARIERDLREFGAELRTAGVARLWDALDEQRDRVRHGTVIIDVGLADAAARMFAEAAS